MQPLLRQVVRAGKAFRWGPLAGLLASSALCAFSCARRSVDVSSTDADLSPPSDPIAALRPIEEQIRTGFDFEKPPSSETGLGADPWAIRRAPGGWVSILRGRSAVVLLNDDLRETARLPTPRSPTGLANVSSSEIIVASELSPFLARYEIQDGKLVARGETRIADVFGLRDVVVSPGGKIWVSDTRGHVLQVDTDHASSRVVSRLRVGGGPIFLFATARHIIVNAVTEHEITVIETDSAGSQAARAPIRIRHDGPLWCLDAKETPTGLLLALGGVEDRPLDRTGGFFGWIDSYVYAYRIDAKSASRVATVNVSEHGVITPKSLLIEAASGDHVELFVTGYGSASAVRLTLNAGRLSNAESLPLVPGVRALAREGARTVMANPLLDAWVSLREREVSIVNVEGNPPRDPRSRLGEALFFTSLMAPRNAATGAHSRFTCETCHFEGYVDGRTHHTGRGEIRATTKPLVGLIGNRPYFSRALDPDLATIAHAEFRVAGAGNPTDPYFEISTTEAPWLLYLGLRETFSPLALRGALMRFLADFSHRPNAAALGRASFSGTEREGARIFRDRCEHCHSARLSADDPSSRIPFERWESLIFSEAAPIVWGSAGYQQTGITPYVHESGARTPSLRRLDRKVPYFTNGSAREIDDVLHRIRFVDNTMFHALDGDRGEHIDEASQRALLAFLELL